MSTRTALAFTLVCITSISAFAQAGQASAQAENKPPAETSPATPPPTTSAVAPGAPVVPAGVELPPGYVLGIEDVIHVTYWKDEEMSADNVVVRPDGKISLPLINELDAAGQTPEQMRIRIQEAATKFVTDPTVSVVVKAINSRRVFIDGQIAKRGAYPLIGPMRVVQLIAVAGGTAEYADIKRIQIVRIVNGSQRSIIFNYKDYQKGKGLDTNIELKPGDTVIVP